MAVEINTGPPLLTINHGSTFMVTDLNGEIAADSEQGSLQETRVSSAIMRSLPTECPGLGSLRARTYYGARIYLTNKAFSTLDGDVPVGTLALVISRSASEGIHEDLDLSNYGFTPVRLNLEVVLRSDFADLFEVKSHRFMRRGRIETEWNAKRHELRTRYTNRDFRYIHLPYRAKSKPPPVLCQWAAYLRD